MASLADLPHVTEPLLRFTVYGVAAPAGSKRHVGGGRVVDASKRSAPWKMRIAEVAREEMETCGFGWAQGLAIDYRLLDGPLAVRMTFYVPRPKGHYSKRATLRDGENHDNPHLVPSAPAYPTTRPDVLKLARAVEDACTGIVWRDDSQIVTEHLEKRYGEPARVEIEVSAAPTNPTERGEP